MKRLITLALLTCAISISYSQSRLNYTSKSHDFGTISKARGKVSHQFAAVNTGRSPLVIFEATVNCGCTKIKYSHKPIMPSDTTYIVVNFDPKTQPKGEFIKTIQVKDNSIDKRNIITISGKITD